MSGHPARAAARDYRVQLHEARRARGAGRSRRVPDGERLGAQLARVVGGMYTSAGPPGPDGPAAAVPGLAAALLDADCG